MCLIFFIGFQNLDNFNQIINVQLIKSIVIVNIY